MIKNRLSNQEIVTMAIFVLGQGQKGYDIETIAKKADELSPGSFRWKTDPNMISDSNVWDALSNARKKKFILEKTSNYFLTELGVEFSSKNVDKLKGQKKIKTRLRGIDKEIYESTKFKIMNSEAYKKILQGHNSDIILIEYRAMFNINKYLDRSQESEQVQKYLNMLINDKDVLNRIKPISKKFLER